MTRCPMCSSPVTIGGSDEGTCYYVPADLAAAEEALQLGLNCARDLRGRVSPDEWEAYDSIIDSIEASVADLRAALKDAT